MRLPTAATVAAVEPEIALKTTAVPSDVNGRLPRTRPIKACTQRTMRIETPPRPRRSPAKMKNGTASSAYLSRAPNMTWCAAVVGTPEKKASATMTVASSTRKNGKPATSSATGSRPSTQPIQSRPCR